jgi:hypothetical protein
MPNINITDSRKRDAVVKAENTTVHEEVRYVDAEGSVASTRKVLKATVAHDYETLSQQFGDDPEKLGYALIEGDPEVDMERCGVFLWGVSKVYVTSDDGIVYRIEQTEKVRDTEGNVKETRPRRHAEANVDAEIPLTWTGRKVKKAEAIRRFVFASKLQVVHVNGLTYDFLYGMASELESENSLMMIGGGSGGRDPLVFRRGSVPYRGFLEGRVQGDQYILLLHLSNMELKVPEPPVQSAADVKETEKSLKEKAKEKKSTKKDVKSDDGAEAKEKKSGTRKKSALARSKDKAKTDTKATEAKKAGKKKADSSSAADKAEAKQESAEAKRVTDKSAEGGAGAVADSAGDNEAVPPSQDTAGQEPVNFEDLGVWLKSIRMGKYLELFIANEIDVDVLPDLTDDDLKELEMPLGSRRRLLKALSEADNLRAEVAMAVGKMSGSTAKQQAAPKENAAKTKKKAAKTKKKAAKTKKEPVKEQPSKTSTAEKKPQQQKTSKKKASKKKAGKKKKAVAKKSVKKRKASTRKD